MAEPLMVSSPVLIYDGDCGFCQWSLAKGRRFLPVMPAAEPLQFADLAGYGITEQEALSAVQFVAADGTVHSGHRAVADVLLSQPAFWLRWGGALLTVPPVSFAAALAYRWVAGHRHLLPGHTDACAVPGRQA